MVPENIHTSPTDGFYFEPHPLPHPSGNSSLGLYFPIKILAFKTLHSLGIFNDHPWGWYGYFLEPHNELKL